MHQSLNFVCVCFFLFFFWSVYWQLLQFACITEIFLKTVWIRIFQFAVHPLTTVWVRVQHLAAAGHHSTPHISNYKALPCFFCFVLFLFPNLSFTHVHSASFLFLAPSSSLCTLNLTQSLEVQGRRRRRRRRSRRSGPMWEPPMELSPLVHTAPRGEVVLHGKLNKTRKTLSVYPSPVQGQTAVRWWKEEVSRGLWVKRMNERPIRNIYKSKVQDINSWCNQAVTSVWLPWPAYSSQNEFWQLSEWQVRTCFMSMDWAMWCEGKERKKEVAGSSFCMSHGSTEIL